MGWQEEELSKRGAENAYIDKKIHQCKFANLKIEEYWEKLCKANDKLHPEIRLSFYVNNKVNSDKSGFVGDRFGANSAFPNLRISRGFTFYVKNCTDTNTRQNWIQYDQSGFIIFYSHVYKRVIGKYGYSDDSRFDHGDEKDKPYDVDGQNEIEAVIKNACTGSDMTTGLTIVNNHKPKIVMLVVTIIVLFFILIKLVSSSGSPRSSDVVYPPNSGEDKQMGEGEQMETIARPYKLVVNSEASEDRKAIAKIFLSQPYEYECDTETIDKEISAFNNFINRFPNSIFVPEALARIAWLHIYCLDCDLSNRERQIHLDKAKECYKIISEKYSNEPWAGLAADLLKTLSSSYDKLLDKENNSSEASKIMALNRSLLRRLPQCAAVY